MSTLLHKLPRGCFLDFAISPELLTKELQLKRLIFPSASQHYTVRPIPLPENPLPTQSYSSYYIIASGNYKATLSPQDLTILVDSLVELKVKFPDHVVIGDDLLGLFRN